MQIDAMFRTGRRRADLSLRDLAARARTSHATLSAYEHGRSVPSTKTADRILRAAGFILESTLVRSPSGADGPGRAEELAQALELAAQFPSSHARTLRYPKFPAAPHGATSRAKP